MNAECLRELCVKAVICGEELNGPTSASESGDRGGAGDSLAPCDGEMVATIERVKTNGSPKLTKRG